MIDLRDGVAPQASIGRMHPAFALPALSLPLRGSLLLTSRQYCVRACVCAQSRRCSVHSRGTSRWLAAFSYFPAAGGGGWWEVLKQLSRPCRNDLARALHHGMSSGHLALGYCCRVGAPRSQQNSVHVVRISPSALSLALPRKSLLSWRRCAGNGTGMTAGSQMMPCEQRQSYRQASPPPARPSGARRQVPPPVCGPPHPCLVRHLPQMPMCFSPCPPPPPGPSQPLPPSRAVTRRVSPPCSSAHPWQTACATSRLTRQGPGYSSYQSEGIVLRSLEAMLRGSMAPKITNFCQHRPARCSISTRPIPRHSGSRRRAGEGGGGQVLSQVRG